MNEDYEDKNYDDKLADQIAYIDNEYMNAPASSDEEAILRDILNTLRNLT